MYTGKDQKLQKKPLKTLKIIDALFGKFNFISRFFYGNSNNFNFDVSDALVELFSSREEYDMELKKYMQNLKA